MTHRTMFKYQRFSIYLTWKNKCYQFNKPLDELFLFQQTIAAEKFIYQQRYNIFTAAYTQKTTFIKMNILV